MKDYLVRFKKVERSAEMGVRVGGLPGGIPRVSGTSVVHYELIRTVCVWLCERACVSVGKGKNMRESTGVATCWFSECVLESVFMCVCVWGGKDRLCLPRKQKATSPRTLSVEITALISWPPDAGRSIQTPEVTSTPTLTGLFAQPWGAAVLRT